MGRTERRPNADRELVEENCFGHHGVCGGEWVGGGRGRKPRGKKTSAAWGKSAPAHPVGSGTQYLISNSGYKLDLLYTEYSFIGSLGFFNDPKTSNKAVFRSLQKLKFYELQCIIWHLGSKRLGP